ncbi:MAG: RNase adapter RapZ [Alphaproteobacteria bacterium]
MTPTAGQNSEVEQTPPSAAQQRTRILLITGMSGAGKSAALKALEDSGYEAVDNLPLSLLSSLVTPTAGKGRPLAIGIDIRTRDFGIEPLLQEIDELIRNAELEVLLLFLDCDDEVLRRRYSETRRRHPLAVDRPVTDGIKHERRLLSALRDRADQVIDTTNVTLNDLRRQLHGQFSLDEGTRFALFVMSFSYRRGLPREADLVFDVRFLDNPHYQEKLRPLTGLDDAVGAFIAADPGYDSFFDSLTNLLGPLLPRFSSEGKSYLTIAVGCTGGRHRSVFIAEQLAAWLGGQGQRVNVAHRDLDK